jgi:N-acetylmuramate 1-kinase
MIDMVAGFLFYLCGAWTLDDALKDFVRTFLGDQGLQPDEAGMETLRGDGSRRLFWRVPCVDSERRFIVLSNSPVDSFAHRENLAYVQIGNHLKSKGIPVPRIYVFEPERGWVVMEDLGRLRLQDVVAGREDPVPLYRRVVGMLLRMQLECAEGFETGWCCQTGHYDRSVMRLYESDYFRDAFLGLYLGIEKDWRELDPAFEYTAEKASRSRNSFFLFRDFQSRNILVDDGRIGFVDWQGGRLGPLGYDLASLLIDPYTSLSSETQDAIFQTYLNLLEKHDPVLADDLVQAYPYLALQRNLQILGAFGNLTKVHGKGYFKAYIPGAMRTLIGRLRRMEDQELSPLKELMEQLAEKKHGSDGTLPPVTQKKDPIPYP